MTSRVRSQVRSRAYGPSTTRPGAPRGSSTSRRAEVTRKKGDPGRKGLPYLPGPPPSLDPAPLFFLCPPVGVYSTPTTYRRTTRLPMVLHIDPYILGRKGGLGKGLLLNPKVGPPCPPLGRLSRAGNRLRDGRSRRGGTK